MTDLVLVNPGNRRQVYRELLPFSALDPPVWAGLTAAYIRNRGYSVKVIDIEAENLDDESAVERISLENPLLVSIVVLGANSCFSTPKMPATSQLLRALKEKQPDIKTILGGIHPSALPERTLREEEVDFVAQGASFSTIERLLAHLNAGRLDLNLISGLWYRQNGQIKSNPPAPPVDPDQMPMTAWDLLHISEYRACNWHCFDDIDQRQPYAAIYTSFGCPFNCLFCCIHQLYDSKPNIWFRSPEKVVEEIDFLVNNYKVKNIRFLDELFTLKEERVVQLCDLIIERGYDLNIWTYARIDTVNERMFRKMKQAGINWIAYGVESGSNLVRRGIRKKFDSRAIEKAVSMAHDCGLYVIADYMFGLPDDDIETMRETLDMAKQLNCEYANFYCAIAYPGSPLYEEAIREGIKLPDDWIGYGQYSENCLPTTKLPPSDVLRFRDNAFKEYFTNPRYIEMIREKFGSRVVEHIEEMLKHEIERKFV